MANKGSTAWLFPLAILAVPALIGYVWWSQLTAETKKQMTLRVRHRTEGVVFGAAPASTKLQNPIAQAQASSSTAVAVSSAAAPAAAAPAPAPATAQIAGIGGIPDPNAAPPEAAQPAPAASAVVASSQTLIVLARDPMMSPYDLVMLQQIELEKEQREQELADAARRKRRSSPPVETRIDLQGIVSTPDAGNKAIVNGDMVAEGDLILGEVKIVRITSQGVVFNYKGHRFTKTISR